MLQQHAANSCLAWAAWPAAARVVILSCLVLAAWSTGVTARPGSGTTANLELTDLGLPGLGCLACRCHRQTRVAKDHPKFDLDERSRSLILIFDLHLSYIYTEKIRDQDHYT